MRTRPAKPGFFKDADLAQCEPLARILFLGLAGLADRDGRLKDKPLEIKAEVLPHDSVNIDTLLNQLASRRLITRYQAGSGLYIQVSKDADTFRKHARPHTDETSEGYPTPPMNNPDKSGDFTASCSVTPLHSSVDPFPSPVTPARAASRRRAAEPAEGFEDFWKAYPRKEAKVRAVEAWNRIQPDPLLRERIITSLARQSSSADWLRDAGRYIPHPATYLNQRRWEDDVRFVGKSGAENGHTVRSASDRTAARYRGD